MGRFGGDDERAHPDRPGVLSCCGGPTVPRNAAATAGTGLPLHWQRSAVTWFSWSQHWLALPRTVDIPTVPTVVEVFRIADHVAGLATGGARYGALLALLGIVGTRPSEALGLAPSDLRLPASGWGWLACAAPAQHRALATPTTANASSERRSNSAPPPRCGGPGVSATPSTCCCASAPVSPPRSGPRPNSCSSGYRRWPATASWNMTPMTTRSSFRLSTRTC